MKKEMVITNKMYTEFIAEAIKTHGYKIADITNKLALESQAITLDQYRAAARMIVDAYYEAQSDGRDI